MNRRKAVIGWLVYTAAKPIVKRAVRSKARAAVPGRPKTSRGPGRWAILAGLGALVGALLFWRSRSSDDGAAGS